MESVEVIFYCKGCKARDRRTLTAKDAAYRTPAEIHRLGFAVLRCETCRREVFAEEVRGVYSATKKCGGACLHAKRGDCECSCAGKNHGTGG